LADQLDSAVENWLRTRGIEPRPPLDLVSLAVAMGVDEISSAVLLEDGRLERTPAHTRIVLKQGLRPARMRFTLAHEIGHLMIATQSSFTAHRSARDSATPVSVEEEVLCDRLAAGLLMPATWLRMEFGRRTPGLDALEEIAAACGTSLAACLIRANVVLDWRRTLLRWESVSGETWRLAAATAVPRLLAGGVANAEETEVVLASLPARGRAHLQLPIRVGGRVRAFPAEISVSPRRRSAVALLAAVH
jgi:hypothetical protein